MSEKQDKQMPKVLTPGEFYRNTHVLSDYVWVESASSMVVYHLQVYSSVIIDAETMEEAVHFAIPDSSWWELPLRDYGVTWRCWSDWPTTAQRSEVKWNARSQ